MNFIKKVLIAILQLLACVLFLLSLVVLVPGTEGIWVLAFVFGLLGITLLLMAHKLKPSSNQTEETSRLPKHCVRSTERIPQVVRNATSQAKNKKRIHTGLKYDDFQWGLPAPTRKQFGYALSLGVDLTDGMTKYSISREIENNMFADEPAIKKQLDMIKEYHGVLPRQITRGEADSIIEFLEDHYLPCPFCGIEICATDDFCCSCDRSLKKLRIPIEIDDE